MIAIRQAPNQCYFGMVGLYSGCDEKGLVRFFNFRIIIHVHRMTSVYSLSVSSLDLVLTAVLSPLETVTNRTRASSNLCRQ